MVLCTAREVLRPADDTPDSRARCLPKRCPISLSQWQTHVRQGPGGVSFRQETDGGGDRWQPADGGPASALTVFGRSVSGHVIAWMSR
jgi:hypothetical protein